MEANAGEYIKKYLLLKRFPRISLHCKLVPVQYWEYEYGLLGPKSDDRDFNRELKKRRQLQLQQRKKQHHHWLKEEKNHVARAARILSQIFAVLCITTTWNHEVLISVFSPAVLRYCVYNFILHSPRFTLISSLETETGTGGLLCNHLSWNFLGLFLKWISQ